MSLAIDRDLETKIRARAEAEGLSVEAYLERLVHADQEGAKELEALSWKGSAPGNQSKLDHPTGKRNIAFSMNG